MARFHLAWRLLAVLSSLSCGKSLDSINLDLEVLEKVDLSALGTPNLDRYEGAYELTVGDDCQYLLRVDFKKPSEETPGNASPNFEGVCAPDNSGGNAPDDKPWHKERRNWMQFPEYVDATTGFNHMSLYWKPCGQPPKGLRQARYDMNFYNIIPQYRAFMTCQTFKSPKVCQYNQTSFLGRGHFSIPTLERDNTFLSDMPLNFQPDAVEPEAYEYEGLISYNNDLIPQTPEDWILPTFLMSSYDGDAVSWRASLPYSFVSGQNSSIYTATQFYVYQRNLRLPSRWNMTYNAPKNLISVYLQGSAGMCGDGFDQAKQEQEGNRKLRG